ncbi:hypothetical protein Tco_0633802 [Tanacetum coccineum]
MQGKSIASWFHVVYTCKVRQLCRSSVLFMHASCTDFLEATNDEYIYEFVSMEKFPISNWVRPSNKVVSFLTRCFEKGNAEALFRHGMLEEALKEKDDLKLKLEKFEESSKNLTKLINSQISAKDKVGLGYDSQMNESEVVHSVFNSRESDVDDGSVNDIFKTGEGFHTVPLPYTRNYMPSRHDLSFAGLDDSVYNTKVSETETSISKTSNDIVETPKTVRPIAPIIEDWDTDVIMIVCIDLNLIRQNQS